MAGYLDPPRESFLDKLLRLRPDSPIPKLVHDSKIHISSPHHGQQRDYDRDSEDGSDGGAAEDERLTCCLVVRTAPKKSTEREQFKWAFPSPKWPGDIAVSQEQGTEVLLKPELSPIRQIHPSQGQMLHISHQHARCAEGRSPMPRFS